MPAKPKPQKRKKTDRKRLISALDKIVSKIVIWRDGQCVQCGTTNRLTNGHLITRSCYSVRWDLRNCNCQCSGHNFAHENHPEYYTDWYIKRFGVADYEELVSDSRNHQKITDDDLEFELRALQEMWDNRPKVYTTALLEQLGYFG